jgi:uncharacterized protein YoxC
MDKILEALSSLLPEDKVKELTTAVNEMLDNSKKELEAEFNQKLEEAYAELSQQLQEAEKTAEQGYQEAYAIINDLRQRLDSQKVEYEKAVEEGYEEAYQMLQTEKQKNETIETELYEEFDNKLKQMKEYLVDMVDKYLDDKATEIREQVHKEVMNDPRMVEHKLTLEKIIETCAGYLSEEDYAHATSKKLEEASRTAEELKGQVRLLEARHIRVSTENNKLNEQVRGMTQMINESRGTAKKEEKKERINETAKVQGRGEQAEGMKIVPEHTEAPKANKNGDTSLVESIKPEELTAYRKLAGLVKE